MPQYRVRLTVFLLSVWILWNYGTARGEEDDELVGLDLPSPKFISKGQKFRAVIGDTVRLPCQVDNLAPFVVLWKRGSSVLSAGDMKITMDKKIQLVNGYDLEIRKVRPQDGGDYVCQLSTSQPLELVHTLEILVPPSVRSEPSHVSITKGDTITLQCRGSGNPVPTISWSRRNNMLPTGENSVVSNSYTIQRADRHSSGAYLCTGRNGVGTPVSTQVEVKVQYPPEIDVERSWIHTGENQEASLTCIVHADPPVTKVKWYRDTMILDTDGRRLMEERGSRHSLIIRKVQFSDFGNYSCEAYNKLGRSSKHIQLSGKPNRAVFRSDPVGRQRDSFNVTWTVESYSGVEEYRLSYRVKHFNETHDTPGPWADVMLPGEGEGVKGGINWKAYYITNLDPGTVYEVRVTARNKFGWGQTSDLFQFSTRGTEHYPFESSPQHDTLADPAVRDMRITSLSSSVSLQPSTLSVVISLLSLAITYFHVFSSECGTISVTTLSNQNPSSSNNQVTPMMRASRPGLVQNPISSVDVLYLVPDSLPVH